ncbi:type VII secretion protein EccE [Gordonia sp. TBRC 11910]|uniref:Type VII secretion protein EccE n=1 Tax=Gordonia asplenii TaxID=2725283 RepID=A0A848L0L8_9ACTN|nr:type VII secretion protein EccE [Gordonia asplenii]NMO02031.1 type VII secretion protein EccE [Gordonia asplenii]
MNGLTTPRRLPRRTRLAVAGELMLAAAFVGWTIIGDRHGAWVLLACVAAVAVAALPPVRTRCRNRWLRTQFIMRRARRNPADVLTAAFDVPVSGTRDGERTSATRMGARWVDDTLITMLALDTDPTAPTTLTPHGIVDPGGHCATLRQIAACLDTFDITVDAVDLISHGQRTTGPAHIAQVYDATLGPLPAVANRATFLVIRLRPADCPAAVARRGGGSSGAIRAAVVTTRRIAAALHDAGVPARILTARQITDATVFLADGAPIADVAEAWSELTSSGTRIRGFAVTADAASAVAASTGWTHSALSTTLGVRIRPSAAGHEYAAVLRVTEHPASNRVLRQPITGLEPLFGAQFEALCATLPVGSSPWLDRRLAWTPITDDGPQPGLGGCGALIGADAAGRGVAVALTSAATVVVAGEQSWVWQLIIRALATGVRIRVATDRVDYWQPLIAVVGDPTALRLDAAGSRDASAALLVVDGTRCAPEHLVPESPGTRLIVVDDARAAPEGELRLIQDPTSPGFVDVETPRRRMRVSIVATPQEWRLLGGIGGRPRPPDEPVTSPLDSRQTTPILVPR